MGMSYFRSWKSMTSTLQSVAASVWNTTTVHYSSALDVNGYTQGCFVISYTTMSATTKIQPYIQVSADAGTSYVNFAKLSQATTKITCGTPYATTKKFYADKIRMKFDAPTTSANVTYTVKATFKG